MRIPLQTLCPKNNQINKIMRKTNPVVLND